MHRRRYQIFLVQHTGNLECDFFAGIGFHNGFALYCSIQRMQDCPESDGDFRSTQCANFNRVPFEGIYYDWVPYTKAPNPCELNCMPRGERFYYRHKDKVVDGTRCSDESNDVCVNGQCQVSLSSGFFGERQFSNAPILL